LQALASSDASNESWRFDLGSALETHAKALETPDRKSERLGTIVDSEEIFDKLARDNGYAEREEKLARLWITKSEALAALDRQDEAKATMQSAIARLQKLSESHPDNSAYLGDLIDAHDRQSKILEGFDDRAGAGAAIEKKELDKKWSTFSKTQTDKANELGNNRNARWREGYTLFEANDYAGALRKFNGAEAAAREYLRLRPSDSDNYAWLYSIYRSIDNTNVKLEEGGKKRTTAALVGSMNAAWIAALLAPKDDASVKRLIVSRARLDMFLHKNGRQEEALDGMKEEIAAAHRLVNIDQEKALNLWSLGNAKCGLGIVKRARNKEPGWEEALRGGLDDLERAAKKETVYHKDVGDVRKARSTYLAEDGHKKEVVHECKNARSAYQAALKAYQAKIRLAQGKTIEDKKIDELKKEVKEIDKALDELAECGTQ
jgi:hypothetical protein